METRRACCTNPISRSRGARIADSRRLHIGARGLCNRLRTALLSCLLLLILFGVGCSDRVSEQRDATVSRPATVDPKDWGPAYTPGIEHGPASTRHSVAAGRAEAFLAKQVFAPQYAKRACAVGGGTGFCDVSFALLEDGTGKTRGTVRVADDGQCSWLKE